MLISSNGIGAIIDAMTSTETERHIKLMKRKDGTLMNTDDDVADNFLYGPTETPEVVAKVVIGDFTYTVFLPVSRQLLESDPALVEQLLIKAANEFDPLSAEARGTPVQFTG